MDKAREVWPLALFSRKRPREMNVMSMVEVSKAVAGFECGGMIIETSIAATLKKNAAVVPRTTSTSIVGEPCESDLKAEM